MVCRTKNNEWGFEGYQPEKPKKVYCCYCKHLRIEESLHSFSNNKYYNCELYYHIKVKQMGPEEVFPEKEEYNEMITDGALEKNKNNDCPDFKPKLRYKLLGKV